MSKKFRVFATCDIGEAIDLLRHRGYQVEVYPQPEAPPKRLIIEKVKSGIDGLITTLRDPIDAEVFEASQRTNDANGSPLCRECLRCPLGRRLACLVIVRTNHDVSH